MIEAFTPGTVVRFKIDGGSFAVITNDIPVDAQTGRKKHDWKIPGYMGEGFYSIRTIPDQRELIASQDDLELAEEEWVCPHNKLPHDCTACEVAADLAYDAAREDRP